MMRLLSLKVSATSAQGFMALKGAHKSVGKGSEDLYEIDRLSFDHIL